MHDILWKGREEGRKEGVLCNDSFFHVTTERKEFPKKKYSEIAFEILLTHILSQISITSSIFLWSISRGIASSLNSN